MIANLIRLKTPDGQLLFEGRFTSVKACLEAAIRDRAPLRGVDLRGCDLRDASLDEAFMPEARLEDADLCGANCSEGMYDGAVFSRACLAQACFADSLLRHCCFTLAELAGTDIRGALLDNSLFAGPSTFSLDFTACASMRGALYCEEDGQVHAMSKPPVVILGLPLKVVFLDDAVKVHCAARPARNWLRLTARQAAVLGGIEALGFYNSFYSALRAVGKAAGRIPETESG